MSTTMGWGIIGSGEIARQAMAPGFADARYGRLVMAMDTRAELAQDIATLYGARWTTDLAELLAEPAVEAVYIAIPHALHAPVAIQALVAGKHVLVEKPIATTLADADAMIAAAKQAGRTLSVAFNAQYDATMVRLRQMIADGLIGKITGTHIIYRSDKPRTYWSGGYTGRAQTDWRTKRDMAGGGVLIMNASHEINTLRYLTGLTPRRVYAEWDNYGTPVEVEDYIAVTIRYDNGAIGTIDAGSAVPGGDLSRPYHRIYGGKGQIVFSNPMKVYLREPHGALPAGEWADLDLGPAPGSRGGMIDQFVQAVWQNVEPPVTGQDGRNALELVLAAYRSGELHQPVEMG